MDLKAYLCEERLRKSTLKPADKGNPDKRTVFESDFGRALFCSAMRRMHDKTQVIPLTNGDRIHTRLTHSMEVMGIAESLGHNLCRNEKFIEIFGEKEATEFEKSIPVIIKTAGLLHDIGNPPFGHFGETIIQNHYNQKIYNEIIPPKTRNDFIFFDGNAQGFRVITKLQFLNDPYGLNLTLATLGAYLKYPNYESPNKERLAYKKHGVFTTEKEYLDTIAQKCNLINEKGEYKRHPLSFLVEAADSICYLTMDIEDGFDMGWYTFEDIVNDFANYFILNKVSLENDDIKKILFNDRELSNRHKVVKLRINLISYLTKISVENFIQHIDDIDKGSYNEELIFDDENKVALCLKQFASDKIFCQPIIERAELTGNAVLNGLLSILFAYVTHENKQYRNRVKHIMSRTAAKMCLFEEMSEKGQNIDYLTLFEEDIKCLSMDRKLRYIVDFVSGMTDKYAVTLYQELSGQKL